MVKKAEVIEVSGVRYVPESHHAEETTELLEKCRVKDEQFVALLDLSHGEICGNPKACEVPCRWTMFAARAIRELVPSGFSGKRRSGIVRRGGIMGRIFFGIAALLFFFAAAGVSMIPNPTTWGFFSLALGLFIGGWSPASLFKKSP